jgi:hypothetical protein
MSRVDVAIECWEKFGTAHNWQGVTNTFYPTEPALASLSAYAITKQEKWRLLAITQLTYANSLAPNGTLTVHVPSSSENPNPPTLYMQRDFQARQIYNFYGSSD